MDAHERAKRMVGQENYTPKMEEAITRAGMLCQVAGGELVSRQAIAAVIVAVEQREALAVEHSRVCLPIE